MFMAHQLTPIGRWIEQRGNLRFGQVLSAHQACLPGVKSGRPADPGQGVDEVLRRMLKMQQTAALVPPSSCGAGLRDPAPPRSRFVRLCYKN